MEYNLQMKLSILSFIILHVCVSQTPLLGMQRTLKSLKFAQQNLFSSNKSHKSQSFFNDFSSKLKNRYSQNNYFKQHNKNGNDENQWRRYNRNQNTSKKLFSTPIGLINKNPSLSYIKATLSALSLWAFSMWDNEIYEEETEYISLCEKIKNNDFDALFDFFINGTDQDLKKRIMNELLENLSINPSEVSELFRHFRKSDYEIFASRSRGLTPPNRLIFIHELLAIRHDTEQTTWLIKLIQKNIESPSAIDLLLNAKNIARLSVIYEFDKFPSIICQTIAAEKLLSKDYYTFVHGQAHSFGLCMRLFTEALGAKKNISFNDYLFPHINSPMDSKEEEVLRKKMLIDGCNLNGNTQTDLDGYWHCRGRLQFMNRSLFSSINNPEHNSLSYVAKYIDNGISKINCQYALKSAITDDYHAAIYSKYAPELQKLQKQHDSLTNYGQLLLIAIPKNKIHELVYVTKCGGEKLDINIKDLGQTSDIKVIMETLLNDPKKIQDSHKLEYGLVKTWDLALDPNKSGVKVFAFNEVDTQKWTAYLQQEQHLFSDIKKDIKAHAKKI